MAFESPPQDRSGRPASGDDSNRPGLWRFMAVGIEFFSPILGGAVAGYYADMYLHTAPVLAVVGVLLGMGLGFYRLFVELREFQRHL